jgi:DNA-binding HxlR family transcriptional regulator
LGTLEATASIKGDTRAGSQVLSLFANPLTARILDAHTEGPLRLTVLHDQINWAPPTTMRAAVNNLCSVGALEKAARGDGRPAGTTTLTAAGEEVIEVGHTVDRWLSLCPTGPIAPNTEEAKSAIKALAGGWNTMLMRALAHRPFTLTSLAKLISDVSYPSLERRLVSMRAAGQIEAVEADDRGTPYMVTEWTRRAVAPLAVAGRCERRHMPEMTAPITDLEVEASFMLTLPLAPLPKTANGALMLAVQTEGDESQKQGRNLVGVTVEVEHGEIVSSAPRINQNPPTWALGTAGDWLDVVIDGNFTELRFGGARPQLAADMVRGLHFALFDR